MRRPFYLNLVQIWLPVGGWVSILHRGSGAVLALLTPALLYALALSLQSPEGFAQVRGFFADGPGWLIGMGLIWLWLHHLFAGLRHMGFDLGLGEDRLTARRSAWAVLFLTACLSLAVVLS